MYFQKATGAVRIKTPPICLVPPKPPPPQIQIIPKQVVDPRRHAMEVDSDPPQGAQVSNAQWDPWAPLAVPPASSFSSAAQPADDDIWENLGPNTIAPWTEGEQIFTRRCAHCERWVLRWLRTHWLGATQRLCLVCILLKKIAVEAWRLTPGGTREQHLIRDLQSVLERLEVERDLRETVERYNDLRETSWAGYAQFRS